MRQQRLSGTAVVETRVRVPTGDAVQRVFSVADAGGLTIVEVENDSTLPIAIAFPGRDGVLTDRPVAAVPIEGIELPRIADRAPGRASRHGARRDRPRPIACRVGLPASCRMPSQVVSGWLSLTVDGEPARAPCCRPRRGARRRRDRRALRARPRRVPIAARMIPPGSRSPSVSCPASATCRFGERARRRRRSRRRGRGVRADGGWGGDVALDAARRVLAAAGETAGGRRRRAHPPRPGTHGTAGGAARRCVVHPVARGGVGVDGTLLPYGLPPAWLGANFEVFGCRSARARASTTRCAGTASGRPCSGR